MVDWTNHYNQYDVAVQGNRIIDHIIEKIYECKFKLHIQYNFSQHELSLLYRWPIYIGVNLFIERLLRVIVFCREQNTKRFPLVNSNVKYFENTVHSVQAYYYDFSINYQLLNELTSIFKESLIERTNLSESMLTPQDTIHEIKRNSLKIKKKIKYFEESYVKFFKPSVVGENSNWFRKLFYFGHCLYFNDHKFYDKKKSIDSTTRERIKVICEDIFITHINEIIKTLSEQQKKQCAKYFSQWIDYILPLSIVEGIHDRFKYYENILINWNPKQVHSLQVIITMIILKYLPSCKA